MLLSFLLDSVTSLLECVLCLLYTFRLPLRIVLAEESASFRVGSGRVSKKFCTEEYSSRMLISVSSPENSALPLSLPPAALRLEGFTGSGAGSIKSWLRGAG